MCPFFPECSGWWVCACIPYSIRRKGRVHPTRSQTPMTTTTTTTPRYSRWYQPLIRQIYCTATTVITMIVRMILHHAHHHYHAPPQQPPPPPLLEQNPPVSIDIQPTTTTPFPHVSQRDHWDCGVACLQMIFTWLSFHNHNAEEENTEDLREWMIETIQTESIWTIDLVYLLHEFCQQQQQQRKRNNGDETVETTTTRKCDRISLDPYSKFTYVMMTQSSLLWRNECGGDTTVHDDRNENHGDSDSNNQQTKNCENHYIHLPYYKDTWVQDRIRMQQRLHYMANSSSTTISSSNRSGIRQMSAVTNSCRLSMEDVIHAVQDENCVALALVDTTIFAETNGVPDTTISTTTSTSTNDDPPKHSSTDRHDSHTYIGHYIIIAGISYHREHMPPPPQASRGLTSSHLHSNVTGSTHHGCLVIYNPASTTTVTQPQYVAIAHFERAWRAYGTDEDIIFITKS